MEKKKLRWPLVILTAVCFVGFLVLTLMIKLNISQESDQQVVQKWSSTGGYAQCTVFYGVGNYADEMQILTGHYALADALREEAITAPNENASLFLEAYSGTGQVTLTTDRASVTPIVLGVTGSFFYFHEYELISGEYFGADDIMDDYLVIDKDVAWQLFGATDVAGLTVEIGGIPFTVRGVIERPSDKTTQAAGLTGPMVIMSAGALQKYGYFEGYSAYEIVMPNPISGFAREKLENTFGGSVVVENSTRFDTLNLLSLFFNRSNRSMVTKPVVYPYWENVARAMEDRLATLTFFRFLCLCVALLVTVGFLISLYRNRSWGKKDVIRWLQNAGQKIRFAFANLHDRWKEKEETVIVSQSEEENNEEE